MSNSSFRWRLPLRKSSTPFFPGAWPNNSTVQDVDTTRSVAVASTPDVRDMASFGGSRQIMQSTPSNTPRQSKRPSDMFTSSSGSAARNADEPLHHIDHVTDFHRRISLSMESSQGSPLGVVSGLPSGENFTDSSRHGSASYMECSSPSDSTIATPSPLSPTTSLSFPLMPPHGASQSRKKPFSLPRIITQDRILKLRKVHSGQIHPSTHISGTQCQEANAASNIPGLPPLSLPSHTLSFSPASVASYFTSSEQSSRSEDRSITTSPPAPPSPPSASHTPASFAIPSPADRSPELPEIPSSPGLATTFYPIATSESGGHEVDGLLSPSSTESSHASGYRNDSPVLPSDEEGKKQFLSPTLSPGQHRGAFTPSSAEMDAFGLAADNISFNGSHESIPTSLRSGIAAESGSPAESYMDKDDTLRSDAYRRRGRASSLSLSLSSIGTMSIRHDMDQFMDEDLMLRRQQRRSRQPSPRPPIDRRAVSAQSVVTSIVSSAAREQGADKANKPTGLEKMKKFSGKIKRLFTFKSKIARPGHTNIGVTTTTAVTNVEYTSEHPIPLHEARRRKEPTISPKLKLPKRLGQQDRRRSLPVVANPDVSRPRALRPASFLVMEPTQPSGRTLLSPSKLAELQQALRGKAGSRSSVRLRSGKSESQVRFEPPCSEPKNVSAVDDQLGQPATEAFSSPVVEHRSRTQTAPSATPTSSPAKARRLSLTPRSTSKMELLRAAIKPHPHLPSMSRDARGRVRHSIVDASDVGSSSTHEDSVRQASKASIRKAKARSMVIRQVYPRKPVPTMDAFDDGNNCRPESMSPEIIILDEQKGQDTAITQNEVPSTVAPPPQPIVSNENGLSSNPSPQKLKNRRSRGSSFTSAVSKRAQKARSMFVGHTDRDAVKNSMASSTNEPLPPSRAVHLVNSSRPSGTLTRGSSLGCAEYDPDLIVENMSFAPKTDLEPSSSAVSENEIALEQDMSNGFVHSILPEELTAAASVSDRSAGEDIVQPEASEVDGCTQDD